MTDNYKLYEEADAFFSAEALKKQEFCEEEKEKHEDFLRNLNVTDDLFEKISNNKSPASSYLLAKYYSEQNHSEDFEKLDKALNFAKDAYFKKLDIGKEILAQICGKYIGITTIKIAAKAVEYDKKNYAEGEFSHNALLVDISGAKPVFIEDFSSPEALGRPLGCDRVDIVATEGFRCLSLQLPENLVGYVDANGKSKELINNSVMSFVSGYKYLAGGCVVTGFDKNYKALDRELVYALVDYFNDFDVFYDGRFFEAINGIL